MLPYYNGSLLKQSLTSVSMGFGEFEATKEILLIPNSNLQLTNEFHQPYILSTNLASMIENISISLRFMKDKAFHFQNFKVEEVNIKSLHQKISNIEVMKAKAVVQAVFHNQPLNQQTHFLKSIHKFEAHLENLCANMFQTDVNLEAERDSSQILEGTNEQFKKTFDAEPICTECERFLNGILSAENKQDSQNRLEEVLYFCKHVRLIQQEKDYSEAQYSQKENENIEMNNVQKNQFQNF